MISDRLKAVADMVPECRCLADIGTDHAYVPIYLAENHKIKKALACDVAEGPLEKATANITKRGIQDRIHVRLSDGFSSVDPEEYDCGVIAGMGGILICRILDRAGVNNLVGHRFVIQPQSHAGTVRQKILRMGFAITDDRWVHDAGKYYQIMSVDCSRVFSPVYGYALRDNLMENCISARGWLGPEGQVKNDGGLTLSDYMFIKDLDQKTRVMLMLHGRYAYGWRRSISDSSRYLQEMLNYEAAVRKSDRHTVNRYDPDAVQNWDIFETEDVIKKSMCSRILAELLYGRWGIIHRDPVLREYLLNYIPRQRKIVRSIGKDHPEARDRARNELKAMTEALKYMESNEVNQGRNSK